MIGLLRRIARRASSAVGSVLLAPAARRLARRPPGPVQAVEVHMLVSSRTWAAGLLAACSLELCSGRRWRFVVHDDGSVPAAGRAAWASEFGESRFIPRAEGDTRTAAFLAAHPRCASHRGRHNLMLKFFDFAAFAESPRYLVLDSDVVFFQKPDDLLDWVDSGASGCLYNEDTREKFCIPRAEIEKALPVSLPPRFNSGLVAFPRAAVDLDLAGRLLEVFEDAAHAPQFFEQTLYALMAGAHGGAAPLPRGYEISWGYWRAPGSICRHYVGEFKHDLLFIEGAPQVALRALSSVWAPRPRSQSRSRAA